GIVERESEAAAIERSRTAAVVAERRRLRKRRRGPVIDAPVDQKSLRRRLVRLIWSRERLVFTSRVRSGACGLRAVVSRPRGLAPGPPLPALRSRAPVCP